MIERPLSRRGALLLGLAGLVWACKGGAADNEDERRPLTATVTLAPVADRHPWVMALLTELGMHPVAGVEARLDQRSGRGGERGPDPVIQAAQREVLSAALTNYEASHPRPPELAPIWEPQRDPTGTIVGWRLYFIEPAGGFVLDGEARAALVSEPDWQLVHLYLSPAQREGLRALSEAHVGDRLALLVDDEALMVPTIREPIPGGEIQIAPGAQQSINETSAALFSRLTKQ